MLGVLVVVVDLVPRVDASTRNATLLGHLNASMTLTIATLFAVAVLASPIDTRVSALRTFVAVVLEVAVLLVLVYAVPALDAFGGWDSEPLDGGGDVAASTAIVVLWTVLAAISTARGLRSRSWLWTWLGLMLFGFAFAGVLDAAAKTTDDVWVTGSLVLRVLALLFVLNGVSQELKRAYLDQRTRFFETRVSAEASEARRRAEQAERDERAHETRTALLAIQSATRQLETNGDGAGHQSTLRDALDAEIELLRVLVERDRTLTACESFDVAATIMPVVECQRAAGLDVQADLAPGLTAFGRPLELAQVVQTLLDNSRVHAPGSPVVVRASRHASRTLVRVEDRGPGVARARRDGIFRRGVTTAASGAGLGLYVARQLVRDQGGDLWVDDRPGGGASFVIAVPASAPTVGGALGFTQLVHDLDDAGQLGHTYSFDPRALNSDPEAPLPIRSGSRSTLAASTFRGGMPLVTTTSKRRMASEVPIGSFALTTCRWSLSSSRASRSPSSGGATAIRIRGIAPTMSGDPQVRPRIIVNSDDSRFPQFGGCSATGLEAGSFQKARAQQRGRDWRQECRPRWWITTSA